MPPASKTLKYTTISKAVFDDVLSRYVSTVPDNLRDLDAFRYGIIPSKTAQRATNGKLYLRKEEVVKLVEWKLKHGTFRPTLLSLVSSNSASEIEDITCTAFSNASSNDASLKATAPEALKDLTKLKGVGPATASLLLSISNLDLYPFFSDELFRWMMWDAPGSPNGWKRSIKYTAKEYELLLQGVTELSDRLGVKAVDMERVAWVLGRNGVDVAQDEGALFGSRTKEDSGVDGEGAVDKVKVKGGKKDGNVGAAGVAEPVKKDTEDETTRKGGKRKAAEAEEVVDSQDVGNGTSKQSRAKKAKHDAKRKSIEPKAPVEGLRRSSRRKAT